MSMDADWSQSEEGAIGEVLRASLELLETGSRPVRRGQHPKTVGCVRAEFEVGDDVPEDLRVGVFAEPRVYPAVVRFSNGHQWDDRKGDIHGVAIKLMGVEGAKVQDGSGRTQDFLLADSPAFFLKDLSDYAAFSRAMARSSASVLGLVGIGLRVVLGWWSPWPKLRRAVSKKPDSPVRTRYWSQTPYALGDRAVKYVLVPEWSSVPEPPRFGSRDRLREALGWQLSRKEARLDFLVQEQSDPERMPVEDASREWDEGLSEPRKVATLRIPAQVFDFEEMREFAEDLSFSPWQARVEHRPLGGINRARRVVYEAMSARRHEANGRAMREPEVGEVPEPR